MIQGCKLPNRYNLGSGGNRPKKHVPKCKSKQPTKYAQVDDRQHYVVVHMYDACMYSVPQRKSESYATHGAEHTFTFTFTFTFTHPHPVRREAGKRRRFPVEFSTCKTRHVWQILAPPGLCIECNPFATGRSDIRHATASEPRTG